MSLLYDTPKRNIYKESSSDEIHVSSYQTSGGV